mgnify:CR=1 FL=1|nr:MAG TPA: hypothetical protein [Caudoviricetes sp.]
MASTSPFGGYKRIQFSGDAAANFEKYNPACRPYEPIAVRKANGHVCVKMNCTANDMPYNDIPIIWDQDVAERLESDLSESQKAAANAKQSETTAKEYAKNAADAVTAVGEKAAAIMECHGFDFVINANDSGIDIVPKESEE